MVNSPNVLFLVADSLRYDVVLNHESVATPTLDELADDGILFRNCRSQGISTAPAMTAMLTGRYPLDYGGHWYIHDNQPTMAEQFRENGYVTGAIHSNPNVSRLRNFDKGFETFEENIVPFKATGLVSRLPGAALRYLNKAARIASRTPYLSADRINEQLTEWIASVDEPWFLWTQYMDTHGPYLPGEEFTYRNKFRAERLWRKAAVNAPKDVTDAEHRELQRNYRHEVEYLDEAVGRFLSRLDADDDLENTIVIVVGDHGDEFMEHGDYGHSNLPYEELVHVPLIVSLPDSLDDGCPDAVDTPVRCLDVLPTALDFADVDVSPAMADRMEGESLRPVLRGESPSYDVIVTEKEMRHESAHRFGLRDGRWTYLYDGLTEEEYLYDREADPAETADVSTTHTTVRDRFRSRLDARLGTVERTSSNVDIPDLSNHPGVEERLDALGYK